MVDFATPTTTYSTKRVYKPITDFSKFVAVKENFLEDETMGLIEQELKSETYSGYINLCKDGEVVIKIRVEAENATQFSDALAKFDDAFAVSVLGTGATAAADDKKRNWKMTFTGVTAVADPFTLMIDESFTTLSNYHKESTCTAVETWADTIEVLSTDVNA